MAWFEAFRNEYGFVSYSDNRTPVTYDIPLITVTYFCALVSIATLIATLGIRGRERWSFTIRAIYAVAIGSIILASIVGYAWQEGSVKVKSPYVYRNNLPFEGYVGVKVGLNFANVTLDGYYRGLSGTGYVYYAESMPWSDFGQESERYSYFLQKGLPEPILRVMEFLTIDEGNLRWGRSYHTSGHYAMALLWTAFSFWIVCNVLLCSVIVYGAYMFTLTGLTMILACVTYHVCQCPLPLVICFGDQNLKIFYSWCFWLTLGAGSLTFLLGILLIITDQLAPAGVSEFFHLEKLTNDESFDIDFRLTESQDSYNRKDRRGTLVPPPTDRRGSIFLDQCRPHLVSDKPKITFISSSNFLPGKTSDSAGGHSKLNPLYSEDSVTKASSLESLEDDAVRFKMERVCEDLEVCLNTKKPSLATLKEHRDNHANEKLSSESDKPTSRYVRQGQQIRRVSYQDQAVRAYDKHDRLTYPSRRRESCPSNVSTRQPSISENSESESEGGYKAEEVVVVCIESEHSSSDGAGSLSTEGSTCELDKITQSCKSEGGYKAEEVVVVCIESEHSSSDGAGSLSTEGSTCELDKITQSCKSEGEAISRRNSQSSCDVECADVVVGISC